MSKNDIFLFGAGFDNVSSMCGDVVLFVGW